MQFSINIFCAGGVTFKTVVKTGAKRNGGTDAKVWERGMRHLIVLQFKCARITNFEIIKPEFTWGLTLSLFLLGDLFYITVLIHVVWFLPKSQKKMMSQAKHMMQCI